MNSIRDFPMREYFSSGQFDKDCSTYQAELALIEHAKTFNEFKQTFQFKERMYELTKSFVQCYEEANQ